jgi:hypothetical protein
MKLGIIVLAVVGFAGCIDTSVSEPAICTTQAISFPVPSSDDLSTVVSVPVSYETSVDLSSSLNKLADIGDVAVSISQNELTSSSFEWLDSLTVSVEGQGQTIVVGSYSGGQSGGTLNLTPGSNTANLLNVLSAGPVVLHFSGMVSGLPTQMMDSLCFSASISKSLSL